MRFLTTVFEIKFHNNDSIWVTENDANEFRTELNKVLDEHFDEMSSPTMTILRTDQGRGGLISSLKVRVPRGKSEIDREVREALTATTLPEIEAVVVSPEFVTVPEWRDEGGVDLDERRLIMEKE